MNNDIFDQLTPEQKHALAEELGLKQLVSQWRAEDAVKDAKRRHEAASNRLKGEQTKFDQIEAAERERFETRLATMRQSLGVAEHEHALCTAALHEAEAMLSNLSAVSGDSYARTS